MIPEDYSEVAYVQQSNGAWLIHLTTQAAVDSPDIENYGAASGLARAKRVALELASPHCPGSGHRWEPRGDGRTWVLWMREEEWDG